MKGSVQVLHVVGGMDRGGVETWLMHVLRNIDREQYRFDFMVSATKPCAFDDEIRTLGSKIISCPHPQLPVQYARHFMQLVKENGPYDVIHSHVHHFSGFIVMLAKILGIKGRITHSHNDTRVVEQDVGMSRKAYLITMEQMIRLFSTHGFACSGDAAVSLYGKEWKTDPSRNCLYCGVDLTPFRTSIDAKQLRNELNIPGDALIIGHVGRFSKQKNHAFLIKVFAALCKKEPNARLLLVGDGALRESIENKVSDLNLSEKVIFAGVRPDIPRLMLGAMDIFLFPSLYEGLGLVLVEAQAASLPCIMSDVIPKEVDRINERIKRVSLTSSPRVWAEAICEMRKKCLAPGLSDQDFDRLKIFSIEESVRGLLEVYDQCERG